MTHSLRRWDRLVKPFFLILSRNKSLLNLSMYSEVVWLPLNAPFLFCRFLEACKVLKSYLWFSSKLKRQVSLFLVDIWMIWEDLFVLLEWNALKSSANVTHWRLYQIWMVRLKDFFLGEPTPCYNQTHPRFGHHINIKVMHINCLAESTMLSEAYLR
jgi:hypothetical protein